MDFATVFLFWEDPNMADDPVIRIRKVQGIQFPGKNAEILHFNIIDMHYCLHISILYNPHLIYHKCYLHLVALRILLSIEILSYLCSA